MDRAFPEPSSQVRRYFSGRSAVGRVDGLTCQVNRPEWGTTMEVRSRAGLDPSHVVVEASRVRLRPILMTSFAFILGVVPLVIAAGAGAEMRQALGTSVFAGMFGVTFFGLFLTPVFYVVLRKFTESRKDRSVETK